MQGEHSSQNSFFSMIYEDLVPADHLLRKLPVYVLPTVPSPDNRICPIHSKRWPRPMAHRVQFASGVKPGIVAA